MDRTTGVKNTFGETVLPHDVAIEQEYERYMATFNSIKRYLQRTDLDYQPTDPRMKKFLVLNFTSYCKQAWNELIPAEFSAVVFSFDEGVVHALFGFVEPTIPLGERGEVTTNCERYALPFPGRFDELNVQAVPEHDVLNGIEGLADEHGCLLDNEILVFAMKSEIGIVKNSIGWLKRKSPAAKWRKYRIVSFEMLLMALSQLEETPETNAAVIKHEGGAGKFLYNNRYALNYLLSCTWHQQEENVGKVSQCASNIGLRRVYNALFYLCHLFQRKMDPMTHLPRTDKIEVVDQQLQEIVGQLMNDEPVIGDRDETLVMKVKVDENVTKYVKVGTSTSPGGKR